MIVVIVVVVVAVVIFPVVDGRLDANSSSSSSSSSSSGSGCCGEDGLLRLRHHHGGHHARQGRHSLSQFASSTTSTIRPAFTQPPWLRAAAPVQPLTVQLACAMVGVQLPKPANIKQGYAIMTAARQKLQTHFGDVCEVVKDDQSAIRLKLHWEHSLFTITLTSNTGYIYIQGPQGKLLPLAESVQDLVGGVVYAARLPGTGPHNPSTTSATSDHADDASGPPVHGATEATVHGATAAATVHGAAGQATVHGAIGQATAEAAIHGASEQASMPNASETAASSVAPSSSGTVSSSPITGSDNIQVGTLVINTQAQDGMEDISTQNVMNTLITGMMNLLRGTTMRGEPA